MKKKEYSPDSLLTVKEAAIELDCSPRTVYNRVRPGSENPFPIKPIRIFGRSLRFRYSDINRYLASL